MKVKLICRPELVYIDEMYSAKQDQLRGSSDAPDLIEYAGRICYDSLGIGRGSAGYHQHLIDVGHGSVLEHAQFTFLISGVSRGLTHELVRHRVGIAISQRSTRYVDESTSDIVEHPLCTAALADLPTREFADLTSQMTYCKNQNRDLYIKINETVKAYLEKKGVDKATAKKQARGAARQYLENGLETELVWSANVRSLRHIINMRGSEHADAEIRTLAVALFKIMRRDCPEYFSDGIIGECKDGTESVSIKPI